METSPTDPAPPRSPSLLESATPILTGLPRRSLTPEQQMEALRKVQAQAEQRVKLGMQLFKSAESRLAAQGDMLDQVRTEHRQLREQVQEDVAKSLQSYDQWMGQIDERFTHAMRQLEQKVDDLADQWDRMRDEMQSMLTRSEAMLDQTRCLIEQKRDRPRQTRRPTPDPAVPAAEPPPLVTEAAAEPAPSDSVPPEPIPMPQPEDAAPEPPPLAATGTDGPTPNRDERIYSQILEQLRQDTDNGFDPEA